MSVVFLCVYLATCGTGKCKVSLMYISYAISHADLWECILSTLVCALDRMVCGVFGSMAKAS